MAKIDLSPEYLLSDEFKRRLQDRLQRLATEIEEEDLRRQRRRRRLRRLSFGLLDR
jgi:hypothetical protein